MLHKVKGRNKYCGPAAMSAIFNIPTHDAARYVRDFNGRTNVMGMHENELAACLAHNNVSVDIDIPKERQTLNKYLSRLDHGVYILVAKRHFIAYCADSKTFADSGAYKAKSPKPIDQHPHPKSVVKWACKISSGSLKPFKRDAVLKSKPENFEQIYDAYACPNLKEAVSARWEQISENVTSEDAAHNCGDDYYLSVDSSDAMSINEAIAHWLNCPCTHDHILYNVINDVADMEMLDDKSDRSNINTIKMLAGKYKLKPQ